MHRQIGVLHQPFLDVVSPSNDPEQPWIGCRVLMSVIDKQSHLPAYALQSCPH